MDDRAPTQGRLRRLVEELTEEGYGAMLGDHRELIVEELDIALHPPVHERRIPSYGALIAPETDPDDWVQATELVPTRRRVEEFTDVHVRSFADGWSSFAVRREEGLDELIVFDRPAGSERDLVVLSRAAQATVVQRDDTGEVRLVGPAGVLRHDLAGWHHEPQVETWLADVPDCTQEGELTVLGTLLAFAVHDLGARGIGAVLVQRFTNDPVSPFESLLPTPPALEITRSADLAPLRHALAQTDGATIFDTDGVLQMMGVRLVPSADAEAEVDPIGGMRHTSARRYSHDDPRANVIVVSDDGPVTLFRSGRIIARSSAAN
ncbi:MAG TPA: diadenylate cyclase [Acidimicrobiales bacterium]|nr:diadenylate cyclase [Acidimicrobiales bacterium]